MRFASYLGIFFLLHLAQSLVIVDSALASSCIYYMKNFNWGCGGTGQGMKMYMCRCANVDWVGSVSNCIETEGHDHREITHAWKHLATRCLQKADIDYTVDELEDYSINATKYMASPPSNISERLYSPISVNNTAYKVYRTSFDEINHHVFKSQWFGWGLVFFWVAFITIHTVSNFLQTCFHVSLAPLIVKQWYQKHLLQKTWVCGCSRGELLLMSLFTLQATFCTALSYTVQLPNMYINTVYFLTLDLIGYRSAIIAFSLMPVVYVFGLRNNPFCYLTGLPQCTFIKYHKFVAIIMSLEALIHSSIWTAYAIRDGGYKSWAIDAYWQWGISGTCLLFVMLGQSMGFIRRFMYEMFLAFHKVLGWLFIVAMWYHCISLGWMGWVYSLIAFTAYDRVVRWFKTFSVNRGFTRIQVEAVSDKIAKLTIPKSSLYESFYKPGSHIYISFYHWSIWYQCFQSHPFTVVSSPFDCPDFVYVYVRVKRGTTASLGKLVSNEKGHVSIWSLIEGPYGNGIRTFQDSEMLVGIAGGLGLCALLPTFYENPSGSILFWVVNNMTDVLYLHSDLDYLMKSGTEVRVYLTREKTENDLLQEKCKFIYSLGHRPDVDALVAEAHETGLALNKKNICVLSCGPGSMDQDVQKSIINRTVVGSEVMLEHKSENYQW